MGLGHPPHVKGIDMEAQREEETGLGATLG